MDKIQLEWSRDKSLLSVQVMTKSLKGRPFPAWTVLVDIYESGEISWNTQKAIDFRKEVIAKLKEDNSNA